ncbi:protein NRT1/ PTR FAMILY 1.2-like [Henckelia pumila]|uniref:protein NRT1/ PTR FAMILY 1.2-like n=1 Tax=Henckelia pumila TaxID=405737 RepID=UPI003C6E1B49
MEKMKMAENLGCNDEEAGTMIPLEISSPERSSRKAKGGIITLPFIIANEAFQMVATVGLTPNMIIYLMNEYRMGVKDASNLMFYWSAASNFTPLIGAFIADSYLGRFVCIGVGCVISFLGMIQLWLTAMISSARPPPCSLLAQPCKSATTGQFALLISSFAIISIGGGGIKPCSAAFGADQIDNRNNPNNATVLERYFSWYYASTVVSVLIALTGVVYIQDHVGWKVGFGVPAILMFCSTLVFLLASSLYIKHKANKSLFTGLLQVIVVAYKNRKLSFPSDYSSGYHREEASAYTSPTDRLRFLNKACIIKNPQDVSSTGVSSNRWDLCTIDQVEELKALIKIIPLWSTGIMVSVNISQNSFPLLQAKSMDRHIGSNFQIPPGSFGMFSIIAIAVWVILYDRVIIPCASKIRGKKVYIDPRLRMGAGIFLSSVAMLVSGIVERIRKRKAIEQGLLNNPSGVVHMSALWLVPQYSFSGFAEALNIIGQIEFYYSEFPKSMSSIATSLSGVGMGVANLFASIILSNVDNITGGGGKESWVSNNINKGHYEYYYWLLATLCSVNMLYFLVCNWFYGPSVKKVVKSSIEGDGL